MFRTYQSVLRAIKSTECPWSSDTARNPYATRIRYQEYTEPDDFDDILPNAENSQPIILVDKVSRSDLTIVSEVVEENLSIEDMEKDLISKSFEKTQWATQRCCSKSLGISERTLYRKIKGNTNSS